VPTSGPTTWYPNGLASMTVTSSIGRLVVGSLALAAAGGTALFFGITHLRRDLPVETSAAAPAPMVSPPASAVRDEGSAALSTVQADVKAAAAALSVSPRSPNADEVAPGFDVARIDRTGDAVIAGRAAPGAIVELLRNGERQDRVVADQSGQFVMVPPLLPPGSYELTLKSTQPDGKQATSTQSVAVALDVAGSSSGALNSRTEARFDSPDKAAANRQPPHATAAVNATPASDGGSSSAVPVSGVATTIVSRGDSLWRISRANYGDGTRYSAVYKANRDQIRNPNLIYPGQILAVPGKPR
jgi:nucleoid-associated protein YgaU